MMREAYENMTPEEKRAFEDKQRHEEIMSLLKKQDQDISHIVKKMEKQTWFNSYASDILANFTSAGVIWLGSKLLKR